MPPGSVRLVPSDRDWPAAAALGPKAEQVVASRPHRAGTSPELYLGRDINAERTENQPLSRAMIPGFHQDRMCNGWTSCWCTRAWLSIWGRKGAGEGICEWQTPAPGADLTLRGLQLTDWGISLILLQLSNDSKCAAGLEPLTNPNWTRCPSWSWSQPFTAGLTCVLHLATGKKSCERFHKEPISLDRSSYKSLCIRSVLKNWQSIRKSSSWERKLTWLLDRKLCIVSLKVSKIHTKTIAKHHFHLSGRDKTTEGKRAAVWKVSCRLCKRGGQGIANTLLWS